LDGVDAVGNITIELGGHHPRDSGTYLSNKAELYPLLKLCLRKPSGPLKLKVDFSDRPDARRQANQDRDLNSLFHRWSSKKWRDFVEQYMSRFDVEVAANGAVSYDILVKKQYFNGPESPGSKFRAILERNYSGRTMYVGARHSPSVFGAWEMSLRIRVPNLRDSITVGIDRELWEKENTENVDG
jgi:hypothetical protein